MKLICFDPAKTKYVTVGEIEGTNLIKEVEPKHFMRVLQGYGIQEIAFEELIEKGIKNIILKEKLTGKKWQAKIKDWLEHGRVADYGHGKQRFLSLKFMKLTS